MDGILYKKAIVGFLFFLIKVSSAYKCHQPAPPIVQKMDLPELIVGKTAQIYIEFSSTHPAWVTWNAHSQALGYSYPIQENQEDGIAILSKRTKYTVQSVLEIKIKDSDLSFSVNVYPQNGCHSVKYTIPITKDQPAFKEAFHIRHVPRDVQIVDAAGGRFALVLSVNVPESTEQITISKWYKYLNDKGQRMYSASDIVNRGTDDLRKSARRHGRVLTTSSHIFDDIAPSDSGVYCADIKTPGLSATVCTSLEILSINSKLGLREINVESCSGNHLKDGVLLVRKDDWDCIKCSVSGFPTPLSFLFKNKTPLAISRQSHFLKSSTEVVKTIWGDKDISGHYYCDGVISNVLRKTLAFKVKRQ